MKVAIMQPYFFPYLGYFSLIKQTDIWVVFDTVQFIRHGWIERNRILKPLEGWQYIQAPLVKHSQKTIIKNIHVRNDEKWQEKIIAQLTHYKKKAPYFNEVITFLENALNYPSDGITHLNTHLLQKVCQYLKIPFNYQIFSTMNLEIALPTSPDEWGLNITKAIKGSTYINPYGGMDFFDKNKYLKAGIELKFLKTKLIPYRQKGLNFEAGLSIIDVMMFNTPEEINQLLDNYTYL
jgi:WbqC-like protein family